LSFLISDNPIMGWTAANVIRRLELTAYGAGGLRTALKMTEKGLASTQPTPIRWRIYHAFGTHYSRENEEVLWQAVWNPKEHEDTRYGAARSLVELAIHAPRDTEGPGNMAGILGRISDELVQLRLSIGGFTPREREEAVRGLAAF